MSPEQPSPGESRAAEVLDALVRERPGGRRRSWQLRQLVDRLPSTGPGGFDGRDPDGSRVPDSRDPDGRDSNGRDSNGAGTGRSRRLHGRLLRVRWVAVAGAVVAAGVLASVLLARRPPPIDDRLPMTSSADGTSTARAAADATPSPDASSAPEAPGSAAAGTAEASSPSEEGAASGEVVVHVAGAVASPGVVRLAATGRIVDAVAAAGGLRPDADPDRVNLAAPVADGQRIVIPVRGEPLPVELAPEPAPGAAPVGGGIGADGGGAAIVDLNSATAEQLDTLPGVGPATAAAILAHREEHGPFGAVDELIDVRGIGEAKLEALRDLVAVSGAG